MTPALVGAASVSRGEASGSKFAGRRRRPSNRRPGCPPRPRDQAAADAASNATCTGANAGAVMEARRDGFILAGSRHSTDAHPARNSATRRRVSPAARSRTRRASSSGGVRDGRRADAVVLKRLNRRKISMRHPGRALEAANVVVHVAQRQVDDGTAQRTDVRRTGMHHQ